MVLALLVVAILVGFATIAGARAMSQSRAVAFDRDWELALHAAEAAADLGFAEVAADPSFTTGHVAANLIDTAAIVAAADARPILNLHPVPGGEFVVVKPLDGAVVYGVGYAPDRAASHRRVRVVAVEYGVEGGGFSHFTIGAAAIAANSHVVMGGGSTTASAPAAHGGSVITNGNLTLTSSSYIDGDVSAVGTVNAPEKVFGSVATGAPPFAFPTDAEVEAWRAQLIANARSEGRIYSSDPRFKNTTITAPLYVADDLTIEGNVTILGHGVIYATGKLKLPGGAIVNAGAVTLVGGTLLEMSGGSVYNLSDPAAGGGLVSFGVNEKALKLSGGSAGSTQGVAFAAYGGIELSGGSTYFGALVARGAGLLGKVSLTGGSDVLIPDTIGAFRLFEGLGETEVPGQPYRSER